MRGNWLAARRGKGGMLESVWESDYPLERRARITTIFRKLAWVGLRYRVSCLRAGDALW